MTTIDAPEHTRPEETSPEPTPIDLTDRLFEATIGTLELFGVHIGSTLGLYEAIDRAGSVTEEELARRAEIHVRYAREWLEQQAVAGFLQVDDAAQPAPARRYHLPAAHRPVLIDPVDPAHVAPFAPMVVGIASALDKVVEAYRTGDGVAYPHYGHDFRHGQGGINRPAFADDLVSSWLPAAGLDETIAAGATVLDLGMGHGWSSIAVKAAWPRSTVLGIDSDEASVAEAAERATRAGVEVRFEVANGDEADRFGPAEVALVLEALHDMANPVEVLASIRRALTDDGVCLVADEAVADEFTAPGDELERMMYGWSISHCLPAAMAEQPSAAIGTAIRASTVAELATAAGFSSVEVVDVDGGFFRIYALRP